VSGDFVDCIFYFGTLDRHHIDGTERLGIISVLKFPSCVSLLQYLVHFHSRHLELSTMASRCSAIEFGYGNTLYTRTWAVLQNADDHASPLATTTAPSVDTLE
jgi:hypothetical protein